MSGLVLLSVAQMFAAFMDCQSGVTVSGLQDFLRCFVEIVYCKSSINFLPTAPVAFGAQSALSEF